MAQNGTWPYDDSSWWSWWWDDQEESDSSWWWDDNEESAELKDLRDQVKAHEDKLNLLLQQMVETTKLVESLQREVQDLQDSGARSSTSEAAPSPSPTPPLLSSHSSSRGPSPAPGRNEACVHRGAGKVVSDQQPREGKEMWSWACHLQSTLFANQPWAQWEQIFNVLTENAAHFEVRDCSTTPANRTFTLVCTRCWASCKGKYGSSEDAWKRVGARQALTQFILGTDALAEDEEA